MSNRYDGRQDLTKKEGRKNKGVAKRNRVEKRREAIARQQNNINRGFYTDNNGGNHTPASIELF